MLVLASFTRFYGGGEIHFGRLTKLLAQKYRLVALVANPVLASEVRDYTAEVHLVKGGSLQLPLRAARLAGLIQRYRPDAIHLNGQSESYIAWALAHAAIPIVATRHVSMSSQSASLKHWLFIKNVRRAKKIVCVSAMVKAQLSKEVDDRKLAVIPNWLPTLPTFMRATRESGSLRLLYVGRLVKSKGVHELIKAVGMVKGVSLDVVGEGPERGDLQQSANGTPITFHGFQTDCAPFYRRASLLVFPSHSEGQGIVPIEAMSHGLPCLVSNLEPLLETTANGTVGETFQVGNVEDLASKIKYLRDTPDRLEYLSAAGYEHVRATYTEDAVRDKYFQLFDSVIAGQ